MPPPDVGRPPATSTEGLREKQSRSDRTATTVAPVRGETPQAPDADQLTIDDLEQARRRRDRGHEVATYATDVAWTAAADRAIRELAASGDEFTAEELRAIVGAPFGSHNAMGPRFMAAARAGLIRRVGYRQATREAAAGRVLAVWRGAS